MSIVLIWALIGCVTAVPPTWYDGVCGVSKLPNAGEKCPGETGPCEEATARIAGGVNADQGEFPFMVSLRDQSNTHICGGTILSEEWILTSARCTEVLFLGIYSEISIVVGDHLLDTQEPFEATYSPAQVIPFEGFEYVSGAPTVNDIAMIKTSSPIVMNEDVSPVCAADPEAASYDQTNFTAIGWGADVRNGDPSNILRYARMILFPANYCSSRIASFVERMLCASDNGNHDQRDICEGDFGGPLLYKDGDTFRVAGIASYELRCGDGYPGVYTDVTHPILNAWITSKIEKS